MGKGQDLYKKARKIIPGGTMLLTKRPEMFLPDLWPSYFKKAKGCFVWDLDGNRLRDMTYMGVGTNSLGYSNNVVDSAVNKTIKLGNLSTLNCPEEVYLAEKLIEINPWAQMVRFARSGGEANSIAIRIARAASGKDNIAICGYHGWHDWYLSANHNNGDDLSDHLIPGLNPNGVPKNLKNSTFPFHYNNYDELKEIVENNNIGVIKMEVIRNYEPENDFLKKVRNLATKKNIVLIFDECSSGFRETYGGIYKKYDVEPDMVMYGKTLGNGYAITAVVGKKEIMESAQNTFISSTFWTERIGPSAALASLNEMQQTKSWEIITKTGKLVREGLQKLAHVNNIEIEITGIPALLQYTFKSNKHSVYKTLIAQEMLKKGFLASTNFYSCTQHKNKDLDLYFNALDEVYKLISKCEKGELVAETLLKGPICHSGFQRLN